MIEEKTYCGFISIVGRPNVGKSTLMNNLLRQKISITSHKIQTTRQCIFGIKTEGPYQIIYIDTPGLQIKEKHAINHLMNQAAVSSLCDADMVIFVIEKISWTADDEMILNILRNNKIPVILAINKIDKIKNKAYLLPHIKCLSSKMNFFDIIPISAKNSLNLDIIVHILRKHLPKAFHIFPEKSITNCSQYFIASEIIREKIMRLLYAELPYSITVEIERLYVKKNNEYYIDGLIFVEQERHKKIVIGNKGTKIKTINAEARKDMQNIFAAPVHLELWVKVRHIRVNYERLPHKF